MKKNKNKKVALVVIIAVILVAAFYFAGNTNTIPTGSVITATAKNKFDRMSNPEWYSLLPAKPADFDEIKLMWEMGIVRDNPERINASYWKQPEWFPLYKESFIPSIESLVSPEGILLRTPVWSLGIFDAQVYRLINKTWLENPNEPMSSGAGKVEITSDSIFIKDRFWIRSAPGAIKIYGVKLFESFPPQAELSGSARFGIGKQTFIQDPEEVKKYISVSTDLDEFLLGNYFPQLDYDYVKEVWVATKINKNIPKGTYVVEVTVGAPSKDFQEAMSWKYGLKYTDPTIGMASLGTKFDLFIEVV